mgnify:CR=1 FL=1
MSEATQRVRDFLTKSPSVVYPDDVLGLFEQVELENAKLREYAHSLELDNIRLSSDNCDLLGEFETMSSVNADLRELVRALDWCTENADLIGKCDQCPLQQSDELTPECEVRMRELGLETEE